MFPLISSGREASCVYSIHTHTHTYIYRCVIKWTKLSERFTKVLPDGRSSIIMTPQPGTCPPLSACLPHPSIFLYKILPEMILPPSGQTRIVRLVSNSSGSLVSPTIPSSHRFLALDRETRGPFSVCTAVRRPINFLSKDKSTVTANHCHTREGKSIFDGGPIGRSRECVIPVVAQTIVYTRPIFKSL